MGEPANESSATARDQVIIGLGVLAVLLTIVSVIALDGVVPVHLAAIGAAFLTGQAWSRTASRKSSASRSARST